MLKLIVLVSILVASAASFEARYTNSDGVIKCVQVDISHLPTEESPNNKKWINAESYDNHVIYYECSYERFEQFKPIIWLAAITVIMWNIITCMFAPRF